MKKFLLSLAILGLAAGMLLALTQTGTLVATITSEEGQILPGANVVLTSNILMGQRTQITGVAGKASFRNLPPGEYTITVTMDGFQTSRETEVKVRIGKTNRKTIVLKLGEAREIVTVVDTSPLVDTSSNTVQVEFDFENFINHMPTGRHYNSLMGMAGGVQAANNPSIFGSGSYDNSYLVDGVNTVDSRTQTWGAQFNVDSIQDVALMKGGIGAEYGHATSVMNIVTKSGSNEFHGVGRLHMQRKEWNDISQNNPDRDDDDVQKGRFSNEWNFSGGGPLVPDMVWFYASYTDMGSRTTTTRRLNVMDDGELTDYIREYGGHFLSIKGTVQIGEDIKATYFFSEDPIDISNAGAYHYYGSRMLPSADFVQKQGGDNMIGTASWVVSEDSFLEGRWSRVRGLIDIVPQKASENDTVLADSYSDRTHFRSKDSWYWGGVPYIYESDRNSDTYGGAFNWLLTTDSLGEHDIKAGVEFLDNWSVILDRNSPSGERIYTGNLTGVGFDNVEWLTRRTYENRIPAAEIHAEFWTVYIQDSIQMTDELTVNLGVRTDTTALYNNLETEIYTSGLMDGLAPRVGFAYDLDGNAIHGSFGRYYDVVNQYLIDLFNVFPVPEKRTNWEPLDGVDGHNGWTPVSVSYKGLAVSPHTWGDTDLMHMDEATLGVDFLLTDTMALSLTGVYRNYRNAMTREDIDGDYYYNIITLETDEYGRTWKKYFGVVAEFRKRPTEDNLFVSANLAWNSLEGFAESGWTGVYLSAPYKNYDNVDMWWDDRGRSTLDAKVQATYFFPNNWYLGVDFRWTNGSAPSSYDWAYWPGYDWYTYNPNGRADMERQDWYNINVQFGIEQDVEFPFDIPFTDNNVKLGIYANIYNLTDNQLAWGVQTYLGSSSYGKPTSWKSARSYLLGFRIEL